MEEFILQAKNGNFEAINLALDQETYTPRQILDLRDENGYSILWWSVYHKSTNLEFIFRLLNNATPEDLNLIPNLGSYANTSILYLAAIQKKWLVLQNLLNRIDISPETVNATPIAAQIGSIPLAFILAHEEQYEILNKLLDRDDITPTNLNFTRNGKSLLWYACENDNYECIELLINNPNLNTTSINSISSSEDDNHATSVLWQAAFNDRWDIVKILLDTNKLTPQSINSIPNRADYAGQSVLWLAAADEDTELTVDILIKMLSLEDLNSDTLNSIALDGESKGTSVLWKLVNHESWQCVDLLLQRTDLNAASINAIAQEDEDKGKSVAWCAARNKNWDLVQRLLNDPRLNLESINSVGEVNGLNSHPSILTMAIDDSRFDIAKQLVNLGCDLDLVLEKVANRTVLKQLLSYDLDIIEEIIHNPEPRLQCPISHNLMLNPVSMTDGYAYDANQVEEWIITQGAIKTSPITRETISAFVPKPSKYIMEDLVKHIKTIGDQLTNQKDSESTNNKRRKI